MTAYKMCDRNGYSKKIYFQKSHLSIVDRKCFYFLLIPDAFQTKVRVPNLWCPGIHGVICLDSLVSVEGTYMVHPISMICLQKE